MPVAPVDLTGSKILITGPTGQVALPVVEHFAKIADVYALARFRQEEDRNAISALGATVIAADLADAASLEQVPEALRPVSLVDTLSSIRTREWQLTRKSLKHDGWAESLQRTHDYIEFWLEDEQKDPDATTTIHEATGRLNRAWRRAREQNDQRGCCEGVNNA